MLSFVMSDDNANSAINIQDHLRSRQLQILLPMPNQPLS